MHRECNDDYMHHIAGNGTDECDNVVDGWIVDGGVDGWNGHWSSGLEC